MHMYVQVHASNQHLQPCLCTIFCCPQDKIPAHETCILYLYTILVHVHVHVCIIMVTMKPWYMYMYMYAVLVYYTCTCTCMYYNG